MLLVAIDLFESDSQSSWILSYSYVTPAHYIHKLIDPFGLLKFTKAKKNHKNKFGFLHTGPELGVELPAGFYIGACEAFAGALLCIIPFPIAQGIGFIMLTDGGTRVFNSLEQISNQRQMSK